MNRLPQELCLIVSREVGEAEWRIDEIMRIVERERSVQEREHSRPPMVSHVGRGYLQP